LQFLDGVLDADDAYVVDLSSSSQDLFPNTDQVQNMLLTRACNLQGTVCDSTDVYWKYIGDFWYHSSLCGQVSSGSAQYRGNYGLCTSGVINSYNSSDGFGNRSGYEETKLWAHPNGAASYQEQLWYR
jgi:hypothetical protein